MTLFGRAYRSGVAVLVIASGVLAVAASARPGTTGSDVDLVLAAMAVVVLVVTAAHSAMRWKLEGAVHALWATVVLLLASGTIALADLEGLGLDGKAWSALAAATLASLCAVVLHAWRTPASAAARPAVVAALACVLVLAAVPVLYAAGVELPRHVPDSPSHRAHGLALAVTWAGVAVACTLQGARRHRHTFVFVGLFAAAVALHRLLLTIAALANELPAAGHAGILLLGALMAARGVDMDVREAFDRERAGAASLLARFETAQTATRRRVHEARNALTAIGGAIQLLEHHHDRLPQETREELATALGSQLARLQQLITTDAESLDQARPRRELA